MYETHLLSALALLYRVVVVVVACLTFSVLCVMVLGRVCSFFYLQRITVLTLAVVLF